MGALHKSAALVGFYGDNLDPAEITAAMGAEPTIGVRRGGTWFTASGVKKVADTGSWRIKAARSEPADLNGQIEGILSRLSDDLDVWRSFSGRYRGKIFCGLFLASWNEGINLTSKTICSIGERGLALDLDVYGHQISD